MISEAMSLEWVEGTASRQDAATVTAYKIV